MTTTSERVAPAAPMQIEDIIGDLAGRKFHDNSSDNSTWEWAYLSDNAYDGNFIFTVKRPRFKALAVRESAARSADRSKGNR